MAEPALKAVAQVLPSILLIEDSASDAVLIEKTLAKTLPEGFHLGRATTLDKALKALGDKEYDVALLDLSLPDSTGFDGLLALQSMAPKLPVIILTAYADEEMALQAIERGAQDYLFKDKIDGKTIRHAMQYAIQRKQFEATLITRAHFDTLTGLANRELFESRLNMAVARAQRSMAGIGVFFFDLNRFKQVNDTLGHAAGDVLLRQVAERLVQCLRPYDTAARFGGDEFALLVEGIANARDCAAIAQKILSRIAQPFPVAGRNINIGVSIGIATCFAGDRRGSDVIMQHADEAMYGAKLSPFSNYRFYTPEIHEQASARLRLEQELRDALRQDELILHYQPKLDLKTGKTVGAEALVRWNHPARGLLLPGEFMLAAEETGLSGTIGDWVLHTVCADITRWRKVRLPKIRIAVNLFVSQLDDPMFTEKLRVMLDHYAIAPEFLALEVPSLALLTRLPERIKTLVAVRALGVSVHLDHFGTAPVSLAALMGMPIDALKISPDVTRNISEPEGMLPLVQAILDIAARFNVDVVASGIENDWQRAFYREQRCAEGQGLGICRPMPGDYMANWLKQGSKGKNGIT